MPQKNKKNSQREVADDFDEMLADFRAADIANASSHRIPQVTAVNTAANAARAQASEVTATEAAILAAIWAGDLTTLRRWHRLGLRYSANIVCKAAEVGSITVMRFLVEELGADVNGANADGCTPVFAASMKGHVNLVRYLAVTLGADINKADQNGATPLHGAAQEGHLDLLQCLMKELGANVNQTSVKGITPLIQATYFENLNVAQFLLNECGADVNQPSHTGTTPVMFASQNRYLAMVQCLGKVQGADVNIVDSEGATALILAAQCGYLEIVQCLVSELGADVNLAAHDGRTALMMASFNRHGKVVRWLIRNGANVQAAAAYGSTAVDASRAAGAPVAQTEYLEAKAHCSYPGCSGAGLKKCTGCKQARYCGQTCQLAHWKAHKADCVYGHKKRRNCKVGMFSLVDNFNFRLLMSKFFEILNSFNSDRSKFGHIYQ
jgi:ankyrin repeat protein